MGKGIAVVSEVENTATVQPEQARLLRQHGDHAEAERFYRASVDAFERSGDQRLVAEIQCELADMLGQVGAYVEARDLYQASLDIFELLDDAHAAAQARLGLAEQVRQWGDYAEAERQYRAALEALETLGNLQLTAVTKVKLADVLCQWTDRAEAPDRYESLATSYETSGIRSSFGADIRTQLADRLSRHGRYADAAELYQSGLAIFDQLGDSERAEETRKKLADLRDKMSLGGGC
jgi:tetratricopeptide (TPR) repeat protein